MLYVVMSYSGNKASSLVLLALTNQPNTRKRVLLEKLIVTQLVHKFPTFYGSPKFIILFTKARQWSLS